MNKIWICGNISTELNLKEIGNNKLCEFSIAVRRYEKTTDFINCVVWNKQAENLVKYQNKGSKISIIEDTPGVTRDRIYSEGSFGDYRFNVIDTVFIFVDIIYVKLVYISKLLSWVCKYLIHH